jgi:RNA polymerase sigma-70 factor (ECF subfamily)
LLTSNSEKSSARVTFSLQKDILSVDTCSTGFRKTCARRADAASPVIAALAVTFSPDRDNLRVRVQPTTFHELYQRYAEDVYRFAYWLAGNPDDAQDLTSETFVRVWTAPEEPRMESVKAYLFAIARNIHNKQLRRKSRQVAFDDAMNEIPDAAASPAQAAVNQEELRQTLDAMQTLPELDRTVLLLRAHQELSYEDIAATTGLSVVAAKVRVFRARAKLAALLEPKTGERL